MPKANSLSGMGVQWSNYCNKGRVSFDRVQFSIGRKLTRWLPDTWIRIPTSPSYTRGLDAHDWPCWRVWWPWLSVRWLTLSSSTSCYGIFSLYRICIWPFDYVTVRLSMWTVRKISIIPFPFLLNWTSGCCGVGSRRCGQSSGHRPGCP